MIRLGMVCRRWPIVGLAILLFGCHTARPASYEADSVLRRQIDGPRQQLPTSRTELERALGRPRNVFVREVANVWEPGVIDRIWTFVFAGLTVEILEANVVGREYLRSVVVESKEVPLRLPVQLGDSRNRVLAILGQPHGGGTDMLEYSADVSHSNRSHNVVRFRVTNDRVARMEWTYWIE